MIAHHVKIAAKFLSKHTHYYFKRGIRKIKIPLVDVRRDVPRQYARIKDEQNWNTFDHICSIRVDISLNNNNDNMTKKRQNQRQTGMKLFGNTLKVFRLKYYSYKKEKDTERER